MPRALFSALFCGETFDTEELREFQKLAVNYRLGAGETIFSEGELADSVFGLSRGVVRLYKALPDGRRQILIFALPGEFLGLALANRHSASAEAIGEVAVCRFSRVELRKFGQSSPNLVRLLLEFTARQLELTQDQLLLISKGTAAEKVATFLVDWRSRLLRVTAVSERVPLPMPRQDIADFLGLTLETVSRTLTKLEQRNAIRIVPKGVLLTGLEQTSLVLARACEPHIPN